MPQFIDYHSMPTLPPEMMQDLVAQIQAGATDPYGVKVVNRFIGADGQAAWCLSEAPDADAVCLSHEAIGIPLYENYVTEVNGLA